MVELSLFYQFLESEEEKRKNQIVNSVWWL